MRLFSHVNKEKQIYQLQSVALATIIGYISRQCQGTGPKSHIDTGATANLTDLTMAQFINYLFGYEVEVNNAIATKEVKEQFNKFIEPNIEIIAKEALYQDNDLRELVQATLEQRAALLFDRYGPEWATTDEGVRVLHILSNILGCESIHAYPLFKYRQLVIGMQQKYENNISNVPWNEILSISYYD